MLTEEYGEYGELGHHGWEQGSSCIIQLCTFGLSRGQTGLEHRPPFIGRCATAHLLQEPRGRPSAATKPNEANGDPYLPGFDGKKEYLPKPNQGGGLICLPRLQAKRADKYTKNC